MKKTMYLYEECPRCCYPDDEEDIQEWLNEKYEEGYKLISLVVFENDIFGAFEKIEEKEH